MNTPERRARRWLLSVQLLADELEDRFLDFEINVDGDGPNLSGCAAYYGQKDLREDIIYVLAAGDETNFPVDRYCYAAPGRIYGRAPHISAVGCTAVELLNEIILLFRRYHDLEMELSAIVTGGGSISDLLLAAGPAFDNPMYVHDNMFAVIAIPRQVEGMLKFEYNQKTGKIYIPLWLIEEFKFDEAYRNTLLIREPGVWGNDEYPYHFRSLFVNLWDGAHYCGRLLINELQTSLKPSQFQTATYLAEYIMMVLRRDMRSSVHNYRNFEDTFVDLAENKEVAPADLSLVLDILGWQETDSYVCLQLHNQDTSLNIKSITVLRSSLTTILSGYTSFFFENDLCLVINLRVSDHSVNEIRTLIARHIRDGYMYCGLSNPFRGIHRLAEGLKQSRMVLDYLMSGSQTRWIADFAETVVPYMQQEICRRMDPELVAAPDLLNLREYDRENGTEYYKTLRAYLYHERSIPATSDALIIHRTTLSYRLKKLKELMSLNLDKEDMRFYLLLSYHLLET